MFLPCWEGSPVSGAGAVCPLAASGCWGLSRHSGPEPGSESLLGWPHGGGSPHPGAVVGVEAHVGPVPAGRPRAWVRPGREGVTAVSWGGPAIIRVWAVIHAGSHVHAQASLGLLLDLLKDKMRILWEENFKFQTLSSLTQTSTLQSYLVGFNTNRGLNKEKLEQKTRSKYSFKLKSTETRKPKTALMCTLGRLL